MRHLNLNFLKITKKNFIVKYVNKSVRIDKATQDIASNEIKGKKPEDVEYKSKFEINTDNLDDYHIIGAEIFKNAFKETIEKQEKQKQGTSGKVSELSDKIMEEEIEMEIYREKVQPLKFQEPNKYYKHFTRRTFYDYANPEYRSMFVPSYRYKIEPFNSLHIFKWGLINGDQDSHNEMILRKNNFVEGFLSPFVTNDPEVDSIISQLAENRKIHKLDYNHAEFHKLINDQYNPAENSPHEGIRTYLNLINKFVELIPSLNPKVLPVILLKSFYEIYLNSKKLWIAIEQEIMNNLHHFSTVEISQISYIANIQSPKYTSLNFRNLLISTAYERVASMNLSLNELFSVSMGFRLTENKILYDKIAENFIKRKEEFCLDKDKNTPSNIANIFYSWSSNRPKKTGPKSFYPQQEINENLIATYEDDLNANILKMNQEDIWRLATALYVLKNDNVDTFINRIERNILKLNTSNPDKVDPFSLCHVIRAFSKMKNGKMAGSDKFFDEIESTVINHIENFKYTFQQITDILYAYSVRGNGSEKFYKVMNRKLNEDIDKANNYHMLHNITWYYLFTQNKNLQQWKELLKKFNQIEGRLPIYYYRPFKIAGYYLKYAFGDREVDKSIDAETITDFYDRFYDPEQIYDYVKYEKNQIKEPEYLNFKNVLNARLVVFPIPHFVHKNLFITHYCWEDRKMGINIWLERDKVPKSSPVKIKQEHLLHSKIMKYDNWEILDIIWEDYINMGDQSVRDKFLYDWFTTTSLKQEQKGICRINPQYV